MTTPKLFTDDDLLLFSLTAANLQLSDAFEAYSSRAGVFLPVGALARLLDIDLSVDPQRQRAEGWVISQRRTILIDVPGKRLVLSGVETPLSDADATYKDGEVYVRISLLEKILPLKISADISGLTLVITPKERLPFQDRLEREVLRNQLGAAGGKEGQPLEIVTPYRLITPPSVDLNLTAGAGNHDPKRTASFDLRVAGDLAGAGLQLFAGSDADFRLNSMRILLTRKDPYGKIAGPFGATRSAIGDTFTPTLTLGARSAAGRGIVITSEPLERASVFDQIDLRGELPLGYQVELYVNEVLRGSQAQPIQGRYEFQGVSLAYGLNTIRLVFYGPRGERREDIRRINVGGGQLAQGQATYSFGAVQEGLNVLDVGRSTNTPSALPGEGKWRVTGSLAYGVTKTTTAIASFAQYTPRLDDTRQMAALGVVTSVAGSAVQLDIAHDNKGGSAVALGAAGRYGATSIVARHSEYTGGFVDEVQSSGVGSITLRRNTNLTIDTILDLLRMEFPASVRVTRDEFIDGAQDIRTDLRLSKAFGRYLTSAAFQYEHRDGGGAPGFDNLNGSLDFSGLVGRGWQLRGGGVYTAYPKFKVQSVGFSADRNTSYRTALHLGVSHTFQGDVTTFEAGETWRLEPADLSLVGSYTTRTNDFRLGIQISMGFGYDPWRSRYALLGANSAAGGAMAVDAFIDANGNGIRDPGEKPLPGLLVQGGRRPEKTDANGHALLTGLGDSASAVAQIDLSSLDDPYLMPAAPGVKIVPRPGRIATAPFPVTVSGEIELHAEFQSVEGKARPISALHVELVSAEGKVTAQGSSEYDGTISIEGLKPGTYIVRMEPSQAERLKLVLVKPVTVTIKPGGGFAGRVAVVVKSQATAQTDARPTGPS